MATTIQLNNKDSLSFLRNSIKHIKDESHKTRVRVIIGIKEGKTRTEVAEEFVLERGTVIDWIKAYNKGGINALCMSKGGRKEGNPKWNTEIFDTLIKEIDTQEQYWSIPLMMKWIKDTYKKEIPEQTVWYQLDKRGYTYKSSRPSPYLGNKEKQESFKKGAWHKA